MAGISTAVSVTDNMTGPLNRITAALYSTVSAFQNVDRASDTAFNPTGIQAVTQELYGYEQRIQLLENDLNQANNKIEEMQNKTRGAKSEAGGLEGIFGKVAGAVAALGIGMVVKNEVSKAIEYASDLTEVQNVVDVTFGEASGAVDAWANTTLNAFGINELSAKKYAGTMGAMLKSSGLSGGAVEDMSTKITELSGDMASFYNLDADEAFNKIRSGISGETEPLKQLGINMSVANLEAYAMSQGITIAYDEMDQASQTLLRYNYLLSTTGDAQGDFARTSDSYANQTKLLSENWTAFTGTLAQQALPMLGEFMSYLNGAITQLSQYTPDIIAVGSVIADFIGGIIEGVVQVGGFISDNWSIIAPVLMGIVAAMAIYAATSAISAAATGIMTAAQWLYNAALAANPIVLIIMAILVLIGVIYAVCQAIAKMTGIANSGFGVICGGINVVLQFFKNLGLGIADVALGIVNVLGAVGSNIHTAFFNVIADIQNKFYSLLSTVMTVVEGVCKALNKIPFVNIDYSGITSAANDYANKAAAAQASKGEYENIGDAWNKGMSTFDAFGDGWVSDAFNSGAAFGDGVTDKISGALDGFGELMEAGTSLDTSSMDSALLGDGADSLAYNAANTADNTKKLADSVDITNEQLKYLRDAAETEAINRFTTAEIKVDMVNHNSVASDIDLDGMVSALSDGVNEAMIIAAEGVHV